MNPQQRIREMELAGVLSRDDEEYTPRDKALERVLDELRTEVAIARAKHAPMNSPHEGWAVIREELDPELWEHVCGNTGRSPEARTEALQIAAMGVRYILDLIDDPPASEYERLARHGRSSDPHGERMNR